MTGGFSPSLPAPVASYVKANNAGDGTALLEAFADDAIVNDVQREFRGKAAIAEWAEREIFGASVSMDVVKVESRDGEIIVTAKLDGTFPKAGLPDPLVMNFYFTLKNDKIARLIILLTKPAS
jgi:ketosteroid isomerase-like protein